MELLKVLFADDEVSIRNGLKYILDWEDCGYKICGEASNGKDAVSQIIDLQPDLVILDIKMPGLTGIEVMAQIKEHCQKNDLQFPAFIILSGYSDFEYAQKTVNNGAKAYLLKPVDEDILKEKIIAIAEELNEKRNLNKASVNASALETKDLIIKLLKNKNASSIDYINKISFFENCENSKYQVIKLSLNFCKNQAAESIEKSLENYFSFFTNVIFIMDNSVYVILKTDNEQAVLNCVERASKLNPDKTFICVGDNLSGVQGLIDSYAQTNDMENDLFFISDTPYISSEISAQKKAEKSVLISKEEINKRIDSLIFCIETYDKIKMGKIAAEVKELFYDFNITPNEIKKYFIYCLIELRNKLILKYPEREISDGNTEEVVPKILEMNEFDEVYEYFEKVLSTLIENFNFNTSDSLIIKVIAYVKNNYDADLKLEALGDMFNCNSAYLGKKFKKYTGVQFNTYLDNIRIEEAKNKLLNTDLKIYQISKLVGYSNTDYFFMKFKKSTGLTPKEFKQKIESENK